MLTNFAVGTLHPTIYPTNERTDGTSLARDRPVTFIWARTFPDSRHDFVAEDAGQHVGRIRRIAGGPQDGIWFWSCTGCQRGHEAEGVRPLNGEAPTRDEAIKALAAAWARARAWSARTGLPLA